MRRTKKTKKTRMQGHMAVAISMAMAAGLALTGCGSTGTTGVSAERSAGGKNEAGRNTAGNTAGGQEESQSGAGAAQVTDTKKGGKDGGTSLIFTTGGDQGTYYGFGGVLAGKIGESTSTSVTAITSGGSQANIEALDAHDADLGFVQSDVMAYAYNGTNLFEEYGKVADFSTVAALYMEQVQIVTLDPSIQSVADLEGKNVSVGAAGSGVYYNAVDVLGAYGLDIEKDINPTYQSFGDSAEALQDGKIDAAFVVAGAPTTAITSLAATRDVYLVSLDDEHMDQLIKESPYYSKNTIPASAYGTDEDIRTVAVGAVVVVRDDVPAEDIYNFCYGVFENMDSIKAAHAKGAELNLEFATSVTAVPYHPGAADYFAEKGMEVPVK